MRKHTKIKRRSEYSSECVTVRFRVCLLFTQAALFDFYVAYFSQTNVRTK